MSYTVHVRVKHNDTGEEETLFITVGADSGADAVEAAEEKVSRLYRNRDVTVDVVFVE